MFCCVQSETDNSNQCPSLTLRVSGDSVSHTLSVDVRRDPLHIHTTDTGETHPAMMIKCAKLRSNLLRRRFRLTQVLEGGATVDGDAAKGGCVCGRAPVPPASSLRP